MPKAVQFFLMLAGTVLALFVLRWTHLLEFNDRQILSLSIFSMFIYGTLLFGEFRLAFAFGGIALLMALRLITVERFTQAASLDVLVFLIGTFLVIGFLEESQFFEYVVSGIVAMIGPRPQTLLIVLMLIGSIASALVGEVTAILFMAGAMLHLTSRYKLKPVPFIIMLVFACNNGSAMSSVGNPIGVLIALKTGLSFVEFLKWAAPVALVVDVATYFVCRWWFADSFRDFATAVEQEFARKRKIAAATAAPALVVAGGGASGSSPSETDEELPEPERVTEENPMGENFYATEDFSADDPDARKTRLICWTLLGLLVALLATHGLTEKLLGLHEGTMMVGAALVMGAVVLFLRGNKARELVERRVDWWTLAFFMMLFASVGTLEDTHVTKVVAEKIKSVGGSEMMQVQIIGWATGWLSAFLDNVLAVATFVPVVHDIRAASPQPYTSAVYWFMLFGGTFMGNMTIIGSTANIVAVGLLEKRGHGTVKFGYWMKVGFFVAIVSMLVATGMLMLMKGLGMPTLPPPGTEAATGH